MTSTADVFDADEKQPQPISYKGQIGGYRPGSGRKPGVPSKYSPTALLATIEATVGKPFAQALAEGYLGAIEANDRKLRYLYEKAILDKVVADKVEVTVGDGDTIEDKMAAFHRALNAQPTVAIPLQATPSPHDSTPSDG